MRITKSMALIGLFAASALTSAAYAGEPGTTATAHFESSRLKSLTLNHKGEVLDAEFDAEAKGLGLTVWVPPRWMAKAHSKYEALQESATRRANELRAKAGVQVIQNPHSQ